MARREPVETKVVAATGATAGGGVVATFVVWLLGVTWQGQPTDADHAASAIGAVPAPVTAIVGLVVLTLSTFLGGYLARHTSRS